VWWKSIVPDDSLKHCSQLAAAAE